MKRFIFKFTFEELSILIGLLQSRERQDSRRIDTLQELIFNNNYDYDPRQDKKIDFLNKRRSLISNILNTIEKEVRASEKKMGSTHHRK